MRSTSSSSDMLITGYQWMLGGGKCGNLDVTLSISAGVIFHHRLQGQRDRDEHQGHAPMKHMLPVKGFAPNFKHYFPIKEAYLLGSSLVQIFCYPLCVRLWGTMTSLTHLTPFTHLRELTGRWSLALQRSASCGI